VNHVVAIGAMRVQEDDLALVVRCVNCDVEATVTQEQFRAEGARTTFERQLVAFTYLEDAHP